MSRIGKKSIIVPTDVNVSMENNICTVSGSKGSLSQKLPDEIKVIIQDGQIVVTRINDDPYSRAQHGLMRSLLANMVQGVSQGFTKQLELVGVGYRATMQGSNLILSVGYSHQVTVPAPEHINFLVEKNTISVKGIDKALVGEIAAKIRSVRKPEPYKGKGIRYIGEVVRRKAGKAAKA